MYLYIIHNYMHTYMYKSANVAENCISSSTNKTNDNNGRLNMLDF